MDLGEASELTPNAYRVASALRVYRACAPRMSGVGLARVCASFCHGSFGVYIQASSSAHILLACSKNPDAHSE